MYQGCLWKPKNDMLSLQAAIELDNLRLKRENKRKDIPDFTKIYAFTDALIEHQKKLVQLVERKEHFYNPLHDPLVGALRNIGKITLEKYQTYPHVSMSDLAADLKVNLESIVADFEALDKAPTTYPLEKVNALRDFCTTLARYENAYLKPLRPYHLCAA